MGKRRAAMAKELNRLTMASPLGFGAMTGTGRIAQQTRFSTWRPMVQDADSVAQFELADSRAFSRDLVRTSPVAAGAIQTRTSHIVGSGLSLQSRIDAAELGLSDEEASEWQTLTERRFNFWAGSDFADVAGELNFYEQQELSLRSHDESGDVFMLLTRKQRNNWPFEFATQIIEADRISNPQGKPSTATLTDGIERAIDGEPEIGRAHV